MMEWYKPTLLDMFEMRDRLLQAYIWREKQKAMAKYQKVVLKRIRINPDMNKIHITDEGKISIIPTLKAKILCSRRALMAMAMVAIVVVLMHTILISGYSQLHAVPIPFMLGVTNIWTNGNGTGLLNDDANWSQAHKPAASEDIVFDSTSVANCNINEQIASVASVTIQSTYTGIMNVTVNQSTSQAWGTLVIHGGTMTWSLAASQYIVRATSLTMDGGTISSASGGGNANALFSSRGALTITGGTWSDGVLNHASTGNVNITITISVYVENSGGTSSATANLTATTFRSDNGSTFAMGTYNLSCTTMSLVYVGYITASTGQILVGGNAQIGNGANNGSITFTDAGTLSITGTTTLGSGGAGVGTITGASATVTHAGAVLLNANAVYNFSTGTTTIGTSFTNGGTVNIGNGSTIQGSVAGKAVVNTGTWNWNNCTLKWLDLQWDVTTPNTTKTITFTGNMTVDGFSVSANDSLVCTTSGATITGNPAKDIVISGSLTSTGGASNVVWIGYRAFIFANATAQTATLTTFTGTNGSSWNDGMDITVNTNCKVQLDRCALTNTKIGMQATSGWVVRKDASANFIIVGIVSSETPAAGYRKDDITGNLQISNATAYSSSFNSYYTLEASCAGIINTTIDANTTLSLPTVSNYAFITSGNLTANGTFLGQHSYWSCVNVTIGVTGTLTAPDATLDEMLVVSGDWDNNGVFNHSNGYVIFIGVNQIIANNGQAFYSITVHTNGSTKTFTEACSIRRLVGFGSQVVSVIFQDNASCVEYIDIPAGSIVDGISGKYISKG